MSTTSVTKYPGEIDRAGDWTNFTVARLGTDDGSTATVTLPALTGASAGKVDTFGFAIPSDATVLELTLEYEMTREGTMLIGAQCSGGLSLSGPGALSTSITTGLPTPAQMNSADWLYVNVTAGNWESTSRTATIDYLRLIAEYATFATVTTDAASDITSTTATCGGETTDDGSGTISACGVCWNTSGSPTLANSYTEDDSGIGTFVSALTGLWSSTTYYIRAWATTEDGTVYGNEVSFTTLASASRSLVARPFTTRAAAAELVTRTGDGLIDWWIEDGVVRAEVRPTSVEDIPRSRWYVVSRDTPGASVSLTMDSEDTPDVICVVFRAYGVTDIRDGTIMRVYSPSAPTTAIQRVQLVDLTGQYMATADAETYAANVLLRVSADVMAATISVKGGLYTVDGQFRAAPLILAGDWIDVVDLPGHVPTYITGTSYSKADHVVTITTGSQEQRELVIPGISALPQALTVFGADTAYESYDGGDVGGDGGDGGGDDTEDEEHALGATPRDPGEQVGEPINWTDDPTKHFGHR